MKTKTAVGWMVALAVVASGWAVARSESAVDDKPAMEKADDGANTTVVADKISTYSAPSVSHGGGQVSGHDESARTLFVSAVVFSGLALAVAFFWLVAPLFGYKFCVIAGNCGGGGGGTVGAVGNGEDSVIVNGGGGGEEASSLFPFSLGYRYDNAPYAGYRKRSLNYVAPILKTLSSAYEKFQDLSPTTSRAA